MAVDRVHLDLCKKATDDSVGACKRAAALLDDQQAAAQLFLYAAGALMAHAGGRFAAINQCSQVEATDAVFQILKDMMRDREDFLRRLGQH